MDKVIDINQDSDINKDMENQSIPMDKPKDKKPDYSPIIPVKLTEENEKSIIELIAKEEDKIMAEYEAFDYFDKFINIGG